MKINTITKVQYEISFSNKKDLTEFTGNIPENIRVLKKVIYSIKKHNVFAIKIIIMLYDFEKIETYIKTVKEK